MGWTNGRQLSSATNGTNSLSFEYDVNGIRTKKIIDGVEHTYLYNGTQLLQEKYGNTILEFQYNAEGKPHCVYYSTNGGSSYAKYYYMLNLQGDVAAMMDTGGVVAINYTYDPWGKVVAIKDSNGNNITSATHMANANPLRYRGYYYDRESQLYYLQSRYYDPEVGRFVNSDNAEAIGVATAQLNDTNIFAYCGNNPISREDGGGYFWNIAAGAVIGGVISASTEFIAQVGECVIHHKRIELDWGDIGLAAAGGAASGALASTGVGLVGQVLGNGSISAITDVIAQVKKGDQDVKSIARSAVDSFLIGGISGLVGGKGIRAKGEALRVNDDTLRFLKGNVEALFANPKQYKQQLTQAITDSGRIIRSAVKSTTLRFTGAAVFSTTAQRYKSYLGF